MFPRETPCLFVVGGLEPSYLGDWQRAKSIAYKTDGTNLSFHLSRMIADHRRNLGRVGKIVTFPILQICPLPSQMISDIHDFEFSLVDKLWDSREAVKSYDRLGFSRQMIPVSTIGGKMSWDTSPKSRLFYVLWTSKGGNIAFLPHPLRTMLGPCSSYL